MSTTFRAYIHDKKGELDNAMGRYGAGFTLNPYEMLEPNGAIDAMMDKVAEHTVLGAFSNATSVEAAITDLDRYAIVQLEASRAVDRAPEMNIVLNRWIQGWRRRLEKFQREHPAL